MTKPHLANLFLLGPDHRVSFGSVQVSMDMLICMQMCPYQSWTNPTERVMSTLNLALQNISLMRHSMDDSLEHSIRHKNSLSTLLKKALPWVT